jgi:hypothetical protein
MRGLITFREGERVVGRGQNLITTQGKNAVLRFLAGMSRDYAGSMVVGLDSTAAAAANTRLGVETARVPVIMRSVDYTNQTVTFKGSLAQEFQGKIFEMGLVPLYQDQISGTYGNRMITTFGADETWTVATSGTVVQTEATSAAASRVGTATLASSINTNSGWISYETIKDINLGGYSATDQVVFGHISATNRLTSLVLTFTDYQGYTATVTQTVTTHSAGDNIAQYNIYRVNKSGFTLSNALFDWSRIVKMLVRTNASATAGTAPNGKGAWDFVGMTDTDSLNVDYLLVSHVSTTPEISCTFQDTGDTVTYNNHNLMAGTPIMFKTITTTTGISTNTFYYVINPTTNTFQVASTAGGAALALTTNGTGVYYSPPLATKTLGKVMDIEYKLVFNL